MAKNYPDFDTSSIDHRMKMLRTDRHKLIWYDDGRIQVYDLESDPMELEDLSTSRPELASRLLGMLEEWGSAQEAHAPVPPLDISDPKLREQLKALGYIE
jgi:hypothetical protein